MKYQHERKWTIHYYGETDLDVKVTDFNYIAFDTVLKGLLSGRQ